MHEFSRSRDLTLVSLARVRILLVYHAFWSSVVRERVVRLLQQLANGLKESSCNLTIVETQTNAGTTTPQHAAQLLIRAARRNSIVTEEQRELLLEFLQLRVLLLQFRDLRLQFTCIGQIGCAANDRTCS